MNLNKPEKHLVELNLNHYKPPKKQMDISKHHNKNNIKNVLYNSFKLKKVKQTSQDNFIIS